jgi:hypothetical protein
VVNINDGKSRHGDIREILDGQTGKGSPCGVRVNDRTFFSPKERVEDAFSLHDHDIVVFDIVVEEQTVRAESEHGDTNRDVGPVRLTTGIPEDGRDAGDTMHAGSSDVVRERYPLAVADMPVSHQEPDS